MSMSKASARNEASGSGSGGKSFVEDCGRHKSTCGYCGSSSYSSITHGLLVESMTVDDYQDLLDRGWRRSGCYVYKPEMQRTCCPSYTIRLKAEDFIPTKDQLRVQQRMERFLSGQLCVNNVIGSVKNSCDSDVSSSSGNKSVVRDEESKVDRIANSLAEQIDHVVGKCIEDGEFLSECQMPKASVKKVAGTKRKQLAKGSELLIYTSSIAFQIAAVFRRATTAVNNHDKLRNNEKSSGENDQSAMTVAEKLVSLMNGMKVNHDFITRACDGHINFFMSEKEANFNKIVSLDTSPLQAGAKSKHSNVKYMKPSEHPQLGRQRIEMHLARSSFDGEEFALYKKYQLKVHNDRPDHVTETAYRRFLVESPLVYVTPSNDNKAPPCGFGSFHQRYVINGHLVAVGVIDILPKCLSSKYLFWDPDYAFLSLGKYSALKEIEWVKDNLSYCPTLQYYYLGYYIHTCNKMRYKAAYRPSELLCPLRYQWVPFDIARPLLDNNKYVVLSDYAKLKDKESLMPLPSGNATEWAYEVGDMDNEHSSEHFMDEDKMVECPSETSDDHYDLENEDDVSSEIAKILIGLNGSQIRYEDIRPAIRPEIRRYVESRMRRYTKLVGVDLAKRMVYMLG